jgi:hypothetical protein
VVESGGWREWREGMEVRRLVRVAWMREAESKFVS